ncbi:MAG: hypothetical protein JWO08_3304 [Verrucomicrobiaceae bacterium]|nr:hypothetical protein [Verrucomicrobiaceae bacterium]
MSKHLISRADYQQIFRTIYTVLAHENVDLTAACVGFNIVGAVILNEFYKIVARPMAGIAGYCVNSEPRSVVMFASDVDGILVPTDGGFHCWIETEEWVVDFTTPLMPLIVKGRSLPDPGPKMMQRRICSAKETPEDLDRAGDFFVHPNQSFTNHTLEQFAKVPFHHDLISICRQWYKRPPRQMRPIIGIGDQNGKVSEVSFSRYQVVGEW